MHENAAHMMYNKALNEIKLFFHPQYEYLQFFQQRKIILNIINNSSINPVFMSISFYPFCPEVKIVKVNFKTV